jgi:dolichol kinase
VLCLAVGDPVAGLIGRRYGRVRLIGRRTLEGSLAFVLSAGFVCWLLLKIQYPTLRPAAFIALAGASAGAIAELLSGTWLDDNLTVPLSVASATSVAVYVNAA